MNSTVRNGGGDLATKSATKLAKTGSGLAGDAGSRPGGGDPENAPLFGRVSRWDGPASPDRHRCPHDPGHPALPHARGGTLSGKTRAGRVGPTPRRGPAAIGSEAGGGVRKNRAGRFRYASGNVQPSVRERPVGMRANISPWRSPIQPLRRVPASLKFYAPCRENSG